MNNTNRDNSLEVPVGANISALNPDGSNIVFNDLPAQAVNMTGTSESVGLADMTLSRNEERPKEEIGSERIRKIASRTALGVLAVSSAYTLIKYPVSELTADVQEKAPFAAGGILVSEGLFAAGAAMTVLATGKALRLRELLNPLRLKAEFGSLSQRVKSLQGAGKEAVKSKLFRAGLAINTLGAIGTAATVGAGAVTALPREMWPGAIGLAAVDITATLGLRAPLYAAMKRSKANIEGKNVEKEKKITIRKVTEKDADRLAEIDLIMFNKAYGEKLPEKEEVTEMFRKRIKNASWMFVAEQNGEIRGFVSAFRTNKSAEEFVSWEESTANGTLEGKVEPKGKYAYVANMTIMHEAVVAGAKDMLLARLFAEAIKEGGAEYGYFESRMPQFKSWIAENGVESNNLTKTQLQDLANKYAELRTQDGRRIDRQLQMYEEDGFELGVPVAEAFDDEASLNFGVVCKAPCPPKSELIKKITPLRWMLGFTLQQVARSPRLLKKVL